MDRRGRGRRWRGRWRCWFGFDDSIHKVGYCLRLFSKLSRERVGLFGDLGGKVIEAGRRSGSGGEKLREVLGHGSQGVFEGRGFTTGRHDEKAMKAPMIVTRFEMGDLQRTKREKRDLTSIF